MYNSKGYICELSKEKYIADCRYPLEITTEIQNAEIWKSIKDIESFLEYGEIKCIDEKYPIFHKVEISIKKLNK